MYIRVEVDRYETWLFVIVLHDTSKFGVHVSISASNGGTTAMQSSIHMHQIPMHRHSRRKMILSMVKAQCHVRETTLLTSS
jgi:hypothetical protein